MSIVFRKCLLITTEENKKDSFWGEGKRPPENGGNGQEKKNIFPTLKQLRHLPKVLSRRERYLVIVLILTAFGSLISLPFTTFYHFTKDSPDFGGTMIEGLIGGPRNINPLLLQAGDTDRDLATLVYSGLMKYDENGKLVPDLAKSYSVSTDNLTYTFNLHDNVKWHDGKPFTADDVVFTITAAQNSDYASPQKVNWQGIDVAKIDNYTVSFKLKNVYGQFLNNTTLGILPQHIWEKVQPTNFGIFEGNIKPVGTGPYKFSSLNKNGLGQIDSYDVTAFDKYYNQKAYIKNITFKFYGSEDEMINAYNRGEVESLSSVSPEKLKQVRFQSKLDIHKINLPRYFAVFFNQNKSKILSDQKVRIALNQATDKKAIIDKLLGGNATAVDSPMMPGILDVPPSTKNYAFNIETAKKTLDDAGWKYSEQDKVRVLPPPAPKKTSKNAKPVPPVSPTKLEIELTTSDWPEFVAVADELKRQWAKVGVTVNVTVMPIIELQQTRKERDYEALLFGEVLAIDSDPFSFWHSSQKKDPGLNLALFDNKNADKLLEDARQQIQGSDRAKKYAAFQDILVDQAPVVFLYSPTYIYPQSNKIKNNTSSIIATPSDRFDSITGWYIETRRVGK